MPDSLQNDRMFSVGWMTVPTKSRPSRPMIRCLRCIGEGIPSKAACTHGRGVFCGPLCPFAITKKIQVRVVGSAVMQACKSLSLKGRCVVVSEVREGRASVSIVPCGTDGAIVHSGSRDVLQRPGNDRHAIVW